MSAEKSECYQCKAGLLPGHNYATILKSAWKIFNSVQAKSKRRPYLRSAYFNGEKIFLDNFWPHLFQKNPTDRKYRLRYFKGALELIKNSRQNPILQKREEKRHETLYRFLGKASGHFFVVQIKEDLKRKQKFFMSVFEYYEK